MKPQFPTLYHKGSKGEIRSWKIWTEKDTVFVEHGIIDGKKSISKWKCTPKNVGKKNATTAESQAILEATAKHKFQLERKYSLTPEKAKELVFLPMLAHSFDKEKKKVKYPVYVQPKLDGVRALASWQNGKVVLTSRSGKVYNVPHISKALQDVMLPDDVFDGEIYIHDKNISFETKMSWIKKLQHNTEKLQYWLYDFPVVNGNDELPFSDRLNALKNYSERWEIIRTFPLKSVETLIVDSEKDVLEIEKKYVQLGYEGAIVRFINGLYVFGSRSHDLLKVKSFLDAEWKVVGHEVEEQRRIIDGEEKSFDCIVWICEYIDEKGAKQLFNVRPQGTLESREETLNDFKKNHKKYLNKMYTVKYQELTQYNAPRFPVGLHFRLDSDK